MNYNIVYKNDNAYQVINEVPIHNFLNSDNTVNQKVLGLYVDKFDCNHVLQKESKFLICRVIEEAVIIND
tara:strand:+ start:1940 stop:2149 length:210 start_codon:yes stop_codon:yes gene_type:complete